MARIEEKIKERYIYHVTAYEGGSVDVNVYVQDIIVLGERIAVANAAWRILMREAKPWENDDKGNTRGMLISMCSRFGTERVKNVFTARIVFDRQRRRM